MVGQGPVSRGDPAPGTFWHRRAQFNWDRARPDYAQAVALLDQAIVLNPRGAEAYYHLGAPTTLGATTIEPSPSTPKLSGSNLATPWIMVAMLLGINRKEPGTRPSPIVRGLELSHDPELHAFAEERLKALGGR